MASCASNVHRASGSGRGGASIPHRVDRVYTHAHRLMMGWAGHGTRSATVQVCRSRTTSFQENRQARVALKRLVSLLGRLVACSARIVADTHRVTLAAHARRGLISIWMEQGFDVILLFLDLSKAFGQCSACTLLHHLKDAGLNPYIVRWIAFYLLNRKQYVVVQGEYQLTPQLCLVSHKGQYLDLCCSYNPSASFLCPIVLK